MGKGDIKSRKGKIANGSYGSRRKKKRDTTSAPVLIKAKPAKPLKLKAEVPASKKPSARKSAADK